MRTTFSEAVRKGSLTVVAVQAAAGAILLLVLLRRVLKGIVYPVNAALMDFLDWTASPALMYAQLATLSFSA